MNIFKVFKFISNNFFESRLNKFEAILLRRFHSNSRITRSKIDVGRVISKIARCGAEADTKGDRITPSMPLES